MCHSLHDFSKAFDSLRFDVILNKMKKIGFSDSAKKLMTSYLTNRKQVVVVDGMSSSMKNDYVGVPQGSLVGPLAYLIASDDLLKIPKGFSVGYVDDLCTYYAEDDF